MLGAILSLNTLFDGGTNLNKQVQDLSSDSKNKYLSKTDLTAIFCMLSSVEKWFFDENFFQLYLNSKQKQF